MESTARAYIGNLPFSATEDDIKDFFDKYIGVTPSEVKIITDRDSGRSKGFGFANFQDQGELMKAVALNGSQLNGRALTINEARPPEKRDRGGYDRRPRR